MNLHEYQGKELLKNFNVEIQKGYVASTVDEAVKCAKKLSEETGTKIFVVKAQIHAGGRGKGGGVKIAKSIDEVKKISSEIIGMQLVTPQTSKDGMNNDDVNSVHTEADDALPVVAKSAIGEDNLNFCWKQKIEIPHHAF